MSHQEKSSKSDYLSYHKISYWYNPTLNKLTKKFSQKRFKKPASPYQMQKTAPSDHQIVEDQQIYLCWNHYWQLANDRLLCFFNIGKFDSFKKPLATITSLSELHLETEDLFCWCNEKRSSLWDMARSCNCTVQDAEIHRDGVWHGDFNEGYTH